jgi:hypothetical protein
LAKTALLSYPRNKETEKEEKQTTQKIHIMLHFKITYRDVPQNMQDIHRSWKTIGAMTQYLPSFFEHFSGLDFPLENTFMGQSITVEVSNTTLLERKIKMR